MRSVLYHQKQKTDPSGRRIYIGEDAYPYAGDGIFIVADGLGGRGGYPHTRIDRRILDRERFYGLVFAPVFGENVSEDFRAFVTDSFREIFETKDYYFENSATTRSSGYFASRLVTAIALYELTYNPDFEKHTLFETLRALPADRRDEALRDYGDKLGFLLYEKLSAIAANVGFEVETRISGAYLLPSTLAVGLTDEREDGVDAVYFWAGDSRAYFWDADGLGQVTEDHEKDETMTNLITLTKPFAIEGRYVSYEKPCLLFNATDGCYKCPVFGSPFDLEYILLQAIVSSDDLDAAMAALGAQFDGIGRHDDSNTMAAETFGFADYAALKEAAKERLRAIDRTVIARLPGILEVDYPAEVQALERGIGEALLPFSDAIMDEPKVRAFLTEEMHRTGYAPLSREMASLAAARPACEAKVKEAEDEVAAYVQGHWFSAPWLFRLADGMGDDAVPPADPAALEEEMRAVAEEHTALMQGALEKFRRTAAAFEAALESLSDAEGIPQFRYPSFIPTRNEMVHIIDLIKEVSARTAPTAAKYAALSEAHRRALADAEAEKERMAEVTAALLDGTADPDRLGKAETAELKALLSRYRAAADELSGIDGKIETADARALEGYRKDRRRELLPLLWENRAALLPPGLVAEISRTTGETDRRLEAMRRDLAVREQIYADYDRVYRRKYGRSRL